MGNDTLMLHVNVIDSLGSGHTHTFEGVISRHWAGASLWLVHTWLNKTVISTIRISLAISLSLSLILKVLTCLLNPRIHNDVITCLTGFWAKTNPNMDFCLVDTVTFYHFLNIQVVLFDSHNMNEFLVFQNL